MDKVDVALRHYEALRNAQLNYLERKRQAKKEAGTYRGRGRPRKNVPTPPPEKSDEVAGVGV